tara:strand:- start:7436 stop:8590 length:1155 start_codon:yes stop_codon:yes gene_type:complete
MFDKIFDDLSKIFKKLEKSKYYKEIKSMHNIVKKIEYIDDIKKKIAYITLISTIIMHKNEEESALTTISLQARFDALKSTGGASSLSDFQAGDTVVDDDGEMGVVRVVFVPEDTQERILRISFLTGEDRRSMDITEQNAQQHQLTRIDPNLPLNKVWLQSIYEEWLEINKSLRSYKETEKKYYLKLQENMPEHDSIKIIYNQLHDIFNTSPAIIEHKYFRTVIQLGLKHNITEVNYLDQNSKEIKKIKLNNEPDVQTNVQLKSRNNNIITENEFKDKKKYIYYSEKPDKLTIVYSGKIICSESSLHGGSINLSFQDMNTEDIILSEIEDSHHKIIKKQDEPRIKADKLPIQDERNFEDKQYDLSLDMPISKVVRYSKNDLYLLY